MAAITVGPPSGDAEIDADGLVVKQVYNAADDVRRRVWLASAGHANIRVVRDGGAVVGGLAAMCSVLAPRYLGCVMPRLAAAVRLT